MAKEKDIRFYWYYDTAEVVSDVSATLLTLPLDKAKALKLAVAAPGEVLDVFCNDNRLDANEILSMKARLGVSRRAAIDPEERFLPRRCYERTGRRCLPAVLLVSATSKCNLNCYYCYNPPGEASTIPQRVLVDAMMPLLDSLRMVVFGGGEPLLDENTYAYIAFLRKHGICPYVSTNGTVLNRKNLDKLEDLGIKHIQISLDSSSETTCDSIAGAGAYLPGILAAIEELTRRGVFVRIRTVVTRDNYGELSSFVEQLAQVPIQAHDITFPVVMSEHLRAEPRVSLSDREMEDLQEQLASHPHVRVTAPLKTWRTRDHTISCGMLKRALVVASNGDVLPCSSLPQLKMGSIYSDTLSDTWNSVFAGNLYRTAVEGWKMEGGECRHCPHGERCAGGCMALRHFHRIPLSKRDPRCKLPNHEKEKRHEPGKSNVGRKEEGNPCCN